MTDLVIDLHTHSNCSDGALAPTDLVGRAAAAGVGVLALTDHDTIAGLDEAARAAAAAGIRLVPGIELSAGWRSQAIHVLGLWIDPCAPGLRERLASQADRRRIRMRRICARLGDLGLPAADLLAGGHVTRTDDAFRKFLGKGRPAHFAADWPPLAEIVGWILDAGGVACLAHPARYSLSSGARRQLLTDFAAAGGTALEVVTGANGAHHVEASTMLAVKYGFSGSIGSDFHSPQQTWNPLGRLAKLSDRVVPVWRAHGL